MGVQSDGNGIAVVAGAGGRSFVVYLLLAGSIPCLRADHACWFHGGAMELLWRWGTRLPSWAGQMPQPWP